MHRHNINCNVRTKFTWKGGGTSPAPPPKSGQDEEALRGGSSEPAPSAPVGVSGAHAPAGMGQAHEHTGSSAKKENSDIHGAAHGIELAINTSNKWLADHSSYYEYMKHCSATIHKNSSCVDI